MKTLAYSGHASSYPVFNRMNNLLHNVSEISKKLDLLYSNHTVGLVCRGSSGMCIASLLCAHNASRKIVFVRKPSEDTHAGDSIHVSDLCELNSFYDLKLVFVDDLISSGQTLRECYKEIQKEYPLMKGFETIAITNRGEYRASFIESIFRDYDNFKLPLNIITNSK